MNCFGALLLTLAIPALAACQSIAGQAVWIDTDPSVQRGGHEVDDGFALLQAFHSPELQIRGISVVFGNAPLAQALPIGRKIVLRFGPEGMPVQEGAGGPGDLGKETPATRAIAAALQTEKLTVLALGPATDIASVLVIHPELAGRINRIIAVAGRRPGQHFLTGKATQPFRDLNFELDPKAFQVILDSGVPLVLAPWEVSSHVWLTTADLNRMVSQDPTLDWLVKPAADWLDFWKTSFDVSGFNPFDTLAVGYAVRPDLLRCETLPAHIETLENDIVTPDGPVSRKPYLLAAKDIDSPHHVEYCFEALPDFKPDLLQRLTSRKK